MVSSAVVVALLMFVFVVFCLALILTLLARQSLHPNRLIAFGELSLPHCLP